MISSIGYEENGIIVLTVTHCYPYNLTNKDSLDKTIALSPFSSSTPLLDYLNCHIRDANLDSLLINSHTLHCNPITTFTHCIAKSTFITSTMSHQYNQSADEMSPSPFEWQLDPVRWQVSPDHDADEVSPGPFDWQFEPALEPSFVSWNAAPCEPLEPTEIFHGPGDVFYNPEATLYNPEDIFYNPEGTIYMPEELFYNPEAEDIFYSSDSEEIFHGPGHEFYNPEGTFYRPEQDIFRDPELFMHPGFYHDPQPGWLLAGLRQCPNARSGPFMPPRPIVCYGPPFLQSDEPAGPSVSAPVGGPRSPAAAGPAPPPSPEQQPRRPASCPPALIYRPQEPEHALRPSSRG